MNFCFYTTGDKQRGMGHIVRSLQLAAELVRRGHGVSLCTEHETPGLARLQKSAYAVEDYHPLDWSWMNRYRQADAVIIDVENGPDRMFLTAARSTFKQVVIVAGSGYALQDWAAVEILSDLVVCQSIIETKSDKVAVLSGVEYILIDPLFAECTARFDGPIVVSMGGGDPHDLLSQAIAALRGIGRRVIALNGQAASELEAGQSDELTIVHGAESMLPYLNGAALFVGALGMSAYEAAAAGVPSILTGWTEDHVQTADELEARGLTISLGLWSDFDGGYMRARVDELLSHEQDWQSMSAAGKKLVNGSGVRRVVEVLAELNKPIVVDHTSFGRDAAFSEMTGNDPS